LGSFEFYEPNIESEVEAIFAKSILLKLAEGKKVKKHEFFMIIKYLCEKAKQKENKGLIFEDIGSMIRKYCQENEITDSWYFDEFKYYKNLMETTNQIMLFS